MERLRLDAKHLTQELTDLVSQLSVEKRTPKEAMRWFGGLDKRLADLEQRVTAEEEKELHEYLQRARRLANKSKAFIEKKMAEAEASSNGTSDVELQSYARLGKLLVAEKDLTLVKALGLCAKATSVEKLGKTLLRLFRDNGQELRLIRGCVEAELLAATSSQGTMFRRNSINSVCLASYARLVGPDYLKNALLPTMTKLTHGLEDYEVDPTKTATGVVPAKNLMNIVARVEELLNHLLASLPTMPRELGFVCHVLASTVSKVMPEARNTAIGGFLMLRFLCPALASPENAGLVSPPADRKRGLILLSKVVINLSNGVELGKKEAFMAPLDPLLDGARGKLQTFYDAIAETFVEDLDAGVTVPARLELAEEAMQVFHMYLEEKHVLEELDETITNHVDLGLNQHTPLMLRQALSRCPPLLIRKSAGDEGARSTGTSGTASPLISPNHSPAVPRRSHGNKPLPAPPVLAGASASSADLRGSGGAANQQRRWSSSRSASAGVAERQQQHGDQQRKSPRLLAPIAPVPGRGSTGDEGRRASNGRIPEVTATPQSDDSDALRKSPRLLQGLQRLLKKEPDHDSGYVSTIFSEEYDPNDDDAGLFE